ncbi:hypothetical protein Tco_0697759 [Tanacetum coccineum]
MIRRMDAKSAKVVKDALDHFCNMSGLKPNMGKSTVFSGNIKDHVKQAILSILPFKIRTLPISYLGVPLISKQVGINDYKKLIVKKVVCGPKDQSGLGLKNLSLWNEVLRSKKLWNMACSKESLWVKWVNVIRLKGKRIWCIDIDPNASSGWKQILPLRGFPAQSVGSSNTDVLDSPCLLVLITGTSQSRQHVSDSGRLIKQLEFSSIEIFVNKDRISNISSLEHYNCLNSFDELLLTLGGARLEPFCSNALTFRFELESDCITGHFLLSSSDDHFDNRCSEIVILFSNHTLRFPC